MSNLRPDLDSGAPFLTPLHLEIVLWYNSRGVDMENLQAPATSAYVQGLIDAGVLQRGGECSGTSYSLTDKGKAYLSALLSVSFPVASWKVEWPRP